MSTFAYIGKPLTAEQFVAYVASYNFGSVPPDQIVIHNSANPDASWAPLNDDPNIKWDRNEVGLNDNQIAVKRQRQLDAIMRYYRDSLGWTAGPHLFVDERWIWLFTPMYEIGVHAAEGNSYHDAGGHLHYSIGIETVGYFDRVGWPIPMQELLRVAVQALRDRLTTFQIVYTAAPAHHPELHQGSIAFHRDYNKPGCPGAAITPAYAIPILASATPHTIPPDVWAGWGTAYPLPIEQRGWAIPQRWLRNAWLGQARSYESYSPDGERSIQWFQSGFVVFEKALNRATPYQAGKAVA